MEKIDIHKTEHRFENAARVLVNDKNILNSNIKLFQKFLDDSAIGKTATRKARIKIVGLRARLKNLYLLRIIGHFYKKDLKLLTIKDIEKLISALEKNIIKKVDGLKYSEQTKSNIKKTFIIFLRWLFGERSKKFIDMTYWIDTKFKKKTIISLDENEVKDILFKCNTIKQKVLIVCLFDGGFRIEEFLNIRNCDIKLVDGSAPYYKMRVRTEFSKTEGREVPMFWSESYEIIKEWLESKTDNKEQEEQFFNGTYAGVRKILIKVGNRSEKKLNAHMFRKSSAQYYANKGYSEFQINKRFGWSAGSDVGGKFYVDQAKINIEDKKEIKEYENAKLDDLKTELKRVKESGNVEIEKLKESQKTMHGIIEKLLNRKIAEEGNFRVLAEM